MNFVQCGSYKSSFFAISLFFVIFLLTVPLYGDSAQPQAQQSMVNPAFEAWQQRQAAPADMPAETQERVLGYIPSPIDWSHLKDEPAGDAMYDMESLPAAFDLRDYGLVSPVKNQLNCGTCWAFATMASVESGLLKDEGQLWDFSENNLKNCHGFDRHPCNQGGNSDMSTAYLTRGDGPVNEADDPYSTTNNTCLSSAPTAQKYVTTKIRLSSGTEVKNAIMNHGAVASNMYYSDSYFDWGTSTYYYPSSSPGQNHGITIIGWDDYKSVPGAPVSGAWLIKNSWGTGWGSNNGYFWISYANTDMITDPSIAEPVVFTNTVDVGTYDKIYQHDPLGSTSTFGYGQDYAWGANRFVANTNDTIIAIGFHTTADNTSYEINIYDTMRRKTDYWGDPYYEFSSSMMSTVSGTFPNAGYYTVELPQEVAVADGDDFIVTVKWTTPGYNYPVGLERWISGYSTAVTSNSEESFASHNGSRYTDLEEYYSSGANICIKALTKPACGFGADIVPDCFIDASDFELFSQQWLMMDVPGALAADIVPDPNGDGTVNLHDFYPMADSWLMTVGQ